MDSGIRADGEWGCSSNSIGITELVTLTTVPLSTDTRQSAEIDEMEEMKPNLKGIQSVGGMWTRSVA